MCIVRWQIAAEDRRNQLIAETKEKAAISSSPKNPLRKTRGMTQYLSPRTWPQETQF